LPGVTSSPNVVRIAINIITGISVFGIAIGTMALILVLSVFNGFEDLLSDLFGHFNPEVKVTPAKGKIFTTDSLTLQKIRALPGVAVGERNPGRDRFFRVRRRAGFRRVERGGR
jgi:hypothetical protein